MDPLFFITIQSKDFEQQDFKGRICLSIHLKRRSIARQHAKSVK